MSRLLETNRIAEVLRKFLEDYDIYDNGNGVEIVVDDNKSIMMTARLPNVTHINKFDIELFVQSMLLPRFVHIFKIKKTSDLRSISPSLFKRLYESGEAEICCIMDHPLEYYSIQYRKVGGVIIAKDLEDNEHIIRQKLTTYQDFKDYSYQQYRLYYH